MCFHSFLEQLGTFSLIREREQLANARSTRDFRPPLRAISTIAPKPLSVIVSPRSRSVHDLVIGRDHLQRNSLVAHGSEEGSASIDAPRWNRGWFPNSCRKPSHTLVICVFHDPEWDKRTEGIRFPSRLSVVSLYVLFGVTVLLSGNHRVLPIHHGNTGILTNF